MYILEAASNVRDEKDAMSWAHRQAAALVIGINIGPIASPHKCETHQEISDIRQIKKTKRGVVSVCPQEGRPSRRTTMSLVRSSQSCAESVWSFLDEKSANASPYST